MAINNTLFPPVTSTYAPAFLIGSSSAAKNTCKIYFSLSDYNSLSEIENIQVSVVNQKTNQSVLNKAKYPCEIMLTSIYTDTTRTSDDKYYIQITPGDIEDGFEINQYYKVQLRFTATEADNLPSGIGIPPTDWDEETQTYSDAQAIDSWLAANLSNFSEWSTVCLIRGISTPTINLINFENTADTTLLLTSNVDIVGKLAFADSAEKDALKQYQIKLYTEDDDLLTDSGILYSNNYTDPNEINYTIKYTLIEGETYYFTLDYETNNMYTDSVTYGFTMIQETVDRLAATLTHIDDVDNGRIGLHVLALKDAENFIGTITIRRTSSESNFLIWEDVHTTSFDGTTTLDYTWWDITIKSGVYYKYLVQKRAGLGNRGIAVHLEKEPVMLLFDDIFLTGEEGQLNIRFDPDISSFKRVISESKVDTIGSKYPHIIRNANTNYRQFPIGGTITHLMDRSNLITSKEEIFQDSLQNYEEFNEENRINDFNDWTYEREFREKVMDFLYANKVRLFRSATEGNILIKLTDINFVPNATLGRRIYSFTATANEIDECSIENYNKYGIQGVGKYNTLVQQHKSYTGQYSETAPANTQILRLIAEKYAREGYETTLEDLDYLRIEMDFPPYLIKEDVNGPRVVNDKGNNKEDPTSAILGYLVYINRKPVIINPEGIYELRGKDVSVTSLTFARQGKVTVDYHVNLSQTEDISRIMTVNSFYRKIGQLWGAFDLNDSIYQDIWNKYYEDYSDYTQFMLSLDGVKIEAAPGTVAYIKEVADSSFERHVIGQTQTLELRSDDSSIEGLYLIGIHLEEANESDLQGPSLPSNKFVDTGIIVNDLSELETSELINNGVYTLTETAPNNNNLSWLTGETHKNFALILQKWISEFDNRYIWYNNQWWLFTNNNDLLCPVDAVIDYYCEVMKGRYNVNE